MEEITISWKNGKEWSDFDTTDIAHMSRDHAKRLLNQGIPVVIRQGDKYIVNRDALAAQYRQKGCKVKMFADVEASDRAVGVVGFW